MPSNLRGGGSRGSIARLWFWRQHIALIIHVCTNDRATPTRNATRNLVRSGAALYLYAKPSSGKKAQVVVICIGLIRKNTLCLSQDTNKTGINLMSEKIDE
jgi:hypothetical protein